MRLVKVEEEGEEGGGEAEEEEEEAVPGSVGEDLHLQGPPHHHVPHPPILQDILPHGLKATSRGNTTITENHLFLRQ